MSRQLIFRSVIVASACVGLTGCGSERVAPRGNGSGAPSPRLPDGMPTNSRGSGGAAAEDTADVIIDPAQPCDTALAFDGDAALNAARAAGLCKMAEDDDDWGLVSARWTLADGTAAPDQRAYRLGHGLLTRFGSKIRPREGSRMLVLSSGTAREPGTQGYVSPRGFDKEYGASPPRGFPKASPACPGITTGEPRDVAALEVVLRAPPGAHSLAFDFNAFTYEWPDFVCSPYNDVFLALLEPSPADQVDDNISFDQAGNLVSVNNALVRVCDCPEGPPCHAPPQKALVSYDCGSGASTLAGTGYEDRAATGWLVTTSPVEPGALIKLRWVVYDSGDGVLDTTTLIDNFRWLGKSEEAPTTAPAPR